MEIKHINGKWTMGKSFKINGVKRRDLINEAGVVFMNLKASHALMVVNGYNDRKANERKAFEEKEKAIQEREDLATTHALFRSCAVMTWNK